LGVGNRFDFFFSFFFWILLQDYRKALQFTKTMFKIDLEQVLFISLFFFDFIVQLLYLVIQFFFYFLNSKLKMWALALGSAKKKQNTFVV